jgi:peptidoglycan/LPS O-acetylase OafA/YrhL
VGIILALAGCALLAWTAPAGISGNHGLGQRIAFLALGAGVSLVLPWLVVQHPQNKGLSVCESAGRRLAAFSYTLYLTNFPVLDIVEKYQPALFTTTSPASFGVFFLKIALCLGVAWLLYLPFERQTAGMRKWLRKVFALGAKRV